MTADTLYGLQDQAISAKDAQIGDLITMLGELKIRCDGAETTAMLRGVELEATGRELRRLRCEAWMAWAVGVGTGIAVWIAMGRA